MKKTKFKKRLNKYSHHLTKAFNEDIKKFSKNEINKEQMIKEIENRYSSLLDHFTKLINDI